MDDKTRSEIEKLLAYILRTDARFMALQLSIPKMLGYNEEQAEEFQESTQKYFKILYQNMLEKAEDIDPALGARLLDEPWDRLNDQEIE